MDAIKGVYIKDVSNLGGLCRICLTESKQMIPLTDKMQQQIEEDVSLVVHALSRVTCTQVVKLYFF